jgi:hypothetical protein
MGSILIPPLRPWRSAARRLGTCRWKSLRAWTGRRSGPSVGLPILSGVPPVASYSCVRVFSRVAVRPHRWELGSTRQEADTRPAARQIGEGWGVSGRGPVVSLRGQGRGLGGLSEPRLRTTPPQGRRSGPVAGGMAQGGRGPNSLARRSTPCQAASGRAQSHHVLSAVLRAGRASTAGLFPLSTPDSILTHVQGVLVNGNDFRSIYQHL